ncbi:MAG: maltose alpha-D-glucosyltransferase [Pseudomonadota bacterium]|nr:maltose alpha-D-glucosyltransferase [Pseudomonadota bacterium]
MARGESAVTFNDDPLWYKDAVVYQLHVKSFFDASNDGIGDFAGLIEKLDYIADLGVNTIWLLPFYPSPRRDDGYDVSAYRSVHPDFGPMADARRFIAEAHKRGLRVITELVINHTSDQHPWFQRARKARPGSSARNFYVWSDNDRSYADTRIIFVDTEKSNWTWDPVAKAYYWHRFYSHQPDLNFDNPKVLDAVLGIMRFWLGLGVDGLRLDAVPYLVEREGTNNENLPETHAVLKRIRAEIDATFPGRMLLAEANQWPEDVQHYFGGVTADGSASQMPLSQGDECHMAFHFPLMPRMYMAIAQEDRFPITDILRQTPEIPDNCQWAIFLRNHDELTLEMVTNRERDYLWDTYAKDRRARLNFGIRRRLAPLVDHDRKRIELLNSLLLSMPGTPVIYYGDEIGMGDNIYLGDRDGVRTPMQWSPDRNGGFSRADPERLVLPPIMDALYGYQSVSVETQLRDPHSLLNWMRRMLSIRSRCRTFGRGSLKLLSPGNRRILAYLRLPKDEHDPDQPTVLCVANMAGSAQAVELDLQRHAGQVPVEMFGGSTFPPIGQLPYLLTLPPHGFYWFMLASAERMPEWHSRAPEPMPEFQTFVLRGSLIGLMREPVRSALERDVLPQYLPRRRWFAAKNEALDSVRIVAATPLPHLTRDLLLLELEVASDGGQRYLLPVGLLPEDEVITALPQQLALARVRRSNQVSLLTDAMTIDGLAHSVIELMRSGARIETDNGAIEFESTAAIGDNPTDATAEVRRMATEQSNSSLVVGEQIMLKLFRRLTPGVHPEAEMGRVLTERGYPNIAPLLGQLRRVDAQGQPCVLGIAQRFIHNQGDAFNHVQSVLQRIMRDEPPSAADDAGDIERGRAELTRFARTLGQRLGEMHAVLAQPLAADDDSTDADTGFAPCAADGEACQRWGASTLARLGEVYRLFDGLLARHAEHPDPGRERLRRDIDQLQQLRPALEQMIDSLWPRLAGGLRIRTHGDLHLGQVLVAQDDVYFVDFEGEPTRTLAERRMRNNPLRDVAGILRSFDYATALVARTMEDGNTRRELVSLLRDDMQQAFVEAWRAHVPQQGWSWSGAEAVALDLFLIERSAYEIAYEAGNRPAWVDVPLRALIDIARRLLLPQQSSEASSNPVHREPDDG